MSGVKKTSHEKGRFVLARKSDWLQGWARRGGTEGDVPAAVHSVQTRKRWVWGWSVCVLANTGPPPSVHPIPSNKLNK